MVYKGSAIRSPVEVRMKPKIPTITLYFFAGVAVVCSLWGQCGRSGNTRFPSANCC